MVFVQKSDWSSTVPRGRNISINNQIIHARNRAKRTHTTIWKKISKKDLHHPFWIHPAIKANTPETIKATPPPIPKPNNELTNIGLILINLATVDIVNAKRIATPTKIMIIEMIITNHFAHL